MNEYESLSKWGMFPKHEPEVQAKIDRKKVFEPIQFTQVPPTRIINA